MPNLRKLFEQTVAQIIPGDKKTAATVRAQQAKAQPAQTVRRPQSTPADNRVTRTASRVFDQFNTFDNGRTFEQRTPTNSRSVLGQATHNAATNVAGNMLVKPVADTVSSAIVEPARSAVAQITGNEQAKQAAETRKYKSLQSSAPAMAIHTVQNAYDLLRSVPGAVQADIRGFQNKAPTQSQQESLQRGLTAFNQSAPGQFTRPVQAAVDKFIPTAAEASKVAGFDPNQTIAQTFIADPVMGATRGVGFVKGVEQAAPTVRRAAATVKANLEEPGLAAGEKASALPRSQVINDNEAGTLRDFADYRTGGYKPGNAANDLHRQARNAAQTAGIDITSGSPAEVTDRIYGYLSARDRFMNARTATSQGGYVQMPWAPDGSAPHFNSPLGEQIKAKYRPAAAASPEERKALDYITNNPEEALATYDKRVMNEFGTNKPNIVSGDEAKFIIPDFGPEKSAAYHEPASALAKVKYEQLLADPATQSQPVMLMAGGSGAGKTSGLRSLLRNGGSTLDDYAAVIDTNSNSLKKAEDRIDEALKTGRPVDVMYVYREPMKSFTEGVLPRGKTTGRLVPVSVHTDTHLGSYEAAKQLAAKYGDNPNVNVHIIDNSGAKGSTKVIDVADLPDMVYNKDNLHKELERTVLNEYQKGNLTQQEAATYLGRPVEPQQPASRPNGTANGQRPERTSAGVVDARKKPRKFTPKEVINRKQIASDHAAMVKKPAVETPAEAEAQSVGEILAKRPATKQVPKAGAKKKVPANVETVAAKPSAARPVEPIAANKNTAPSKFPIRVSQREDAVPLHDRLKELSTHPVLHNADVARAAGERIARNEDEALAFAKHSETTEANSTAILLLDKYLKEGSMERADELLQTVSPRFTKQGQQIQILATFSRLTPAGAVKYASREVEKAAGKTAKGRKLDEQTEAATKEIKEVNRTAAKQLQMDLEKGKIGKAIKATRTPAAKKGKSPEEMLARRIKASTASKDGKPDPIKDMVSTLYKVAKEHLPAEQRKQLRNPMTLIGQAIREKEKYTDVWGKAQEIVQKRYKDNPQALEELDQYFSSSLTRPFAKSQLNKGVQQGLQGVDLGKLVRKHYTVVDETGADLKKKLIEQAGLTPTQATQLSQEIQKRFTELTQAKKDSILKQMFGDKPTPEQKSAAQRIIESTNLGAFTRDDIRPLIAQKLGIPHLTPEAAGKITSMANDLQKLEVGSKERNLATAKMMQFIEKQIPTGKMDAAISIWKAGLLSGIKTQGGNFASNATFGALKKASDIPTAAADAVIGLFTKKRTATVTGRGIAAGTKEGAKSGVDTLKTGIDMRRISDKYEHYGEINLKNKVLQKVLGTPANYIFRGMSAADQPFYYAALKNSMYDQARAEGFNNGLRGAELKSFMERTVKSPNDRMVEVATREANKAVLGYDTFASKAISAAHRGIDQVGEGSNAGKAAAHAALNILAPFVRVPSAFISRTVDFTPLGIPKEIFSQVSHSRFDQRRLAQAIGEGATGTGLIALGIALTQNNLLSGAYPKNDQKEQQRWKAEGITANSVKLGNTWVSLNYLGPLGLLFGAGRNLEKAKSESAASKAGRAVAGLGQGLLAQSFLTGLTGFNDALQDPERSAKSYLNSQAGSTVPAVLNDLGNLIDKYQRQADTPLDAIKNRIPGLRQTNKRKQDVYGNDLKQPSTGLNVLNPFKPSDEITSATTAEVKRLHNVDPDNTDLQVTPTPLGREVALGAKDAEGNAVKTALSNDQRYDLQKQVGQATQSAWGELIKTDDYKGLADSDKAAALSNLRQDVMKATLATYAAKNNVGQYANDYTGEATKPSKAVSTILNGNLDVTSYAHAGGQANGTKIDGDKRGTALLDKVGSFNSDQLKEWQDKPFDDNFDDVYKRASQIRFAGLPDLPKNNQVLKLYSDLIKKRSESKLTPFGENKEKMKFLKAAYKTDLPKDSQEILSASTTEILSAIDSGTITADMVAQAVKYDNELLKSGLSSSADIPAKVRKALGLGEAPDRDGSSSSKKSKDYSLYSSVDPVATNKRLRDLVEAARLT